MPDPNDGKKRMSRGVRLAIMGVGGAALLYSCAPAIAGLGGLGALPLLWGMTNPFYRGAMAPNCGPAVPGAPACAPNQTSTSGAGGSGTGSGFRSGGSSGSSATSSTSGDSASSTSSRGGFGSTASSHSSSGSS